MSRFKVIIIGFVLGMGGQVQAGPLSACAPVDLRSQFQDRVRNQGDLSWCYAYTAADYLQFFNRISEPISAADIAIRYNLNLWPRILQLIRGGIVPETGFVRAALWEELDEGYCPESVFPSDAWVRTVRSPLGDRSESRSLLSAIEDLYRLQGWVQEGVFQKSSELPYAYAFPTVSEEELFTLLREESRADLLNAIRERACDAQRKEFPRSVDRISMRFKGEGFFPRVHEHLTRGLPISVDYFYGVLEHADSIPHTISDLHTSLIMGQKRDLATGECLYLIRNSFGTGCTSYDPRWECQEGYLWISEGALARAMVSYVSMENESF